MTALRLQTGGKQQIFPASLGVEVGCVGSKRGVGGWRGRDEGGRAEKQ